MADKGIGEQIAELLAAGAQWFTLRMPQESDSETVTKAITEAVNACLGSEAILVVDGFPELALDTLVGPVRASGTVVSARHGDFAALREKLGPHAVIGYNAETPEEILALAGQDVDYFTLPVEAMTQALDSVEVPIVAVGADELPSGFMGIIKKV